MIKIIQNTDKTDTTNEHNIDHNAANANLSSK